MFLGLFLRDFDEDGVQGCLIASRPIVFQLYAVIGSITFLDLDINSLLRRKANFPCLDLR